VERGRLFLSTQLGLPRVCDGVTVKGKEFYKISSQRRKNDRGGKNKIRKEKKTGGFLDKIAVGGDSTTKG